MNSKNSNCVCMDDWFWPNQQCILAWIYYLEQVICWENMLVWDSNTNKHIRSIICFYPKFKRLSLPNTNVSTAMYYKTVEVYCTFPEVTFPEILQQNEGLGHKTRYWFAFNFPVELWCCLRFCFPSQNIITKECVKCYRSQLKFSLSLSLLILQQLFRVHVFHHSCKNHPESSNHKLMCDCHLLYFTLPS